MLMKVFLITLGIVAMAVFGLCFNIIFRKNGEFPEYEVSSNKEMRKLGIKCMREQDDAIFGASDSPRHTGCEGNDDDACRGCTLYKG